MKITLSHARVAYECALERRGSEPPTMADCRRRLTKAGLPSGSGPILIAIVSKLLDGKVFKRAPSVPVADAFLGWIKDDFGLNGLARAVKSLAEFIHYYENEYSVRLESMRSVRDKHGAAVTGAGSAISLEPYMLIRWDDVSVRDVIPQDWLEDDVPRKKASHQMQRRNGRRDGEATCDVVKNGMTVILDYRGYPKENVANGAELGETRLTFADDDRTKLLKVEWKGENENAFNETGVVEGGTDIPPSSPPYVRPTKPSPKTETWVRERPGQRKFRQNLKKAYGFRCCFSACAVVQALEGAHIDRYEAPESDNLRNGLLLRRDIHALYDAHLIAIHPKTFLLQLADSVRRDPTYMSLHGALVKPPRSKAHSPDQAALQRRWDRFQSNPHAQ